MSEVRICVVGAGVIGLGTTLCIQETLRNKLGHTSYQCDVIAERFTPNLISDVAAGLWEPYLDAVSRHEEASLSKWAVPTLKFLKKLLLRSDLNETGLQLISGYVLTDPGAEDPCWKKDAINYHRMSEAELEMFPDYKAGFGFTTPVCEQSKYLSYLMKQLRKTGVRFIQKKVDDLAQLCSDYDVIVNCAGIGARQLVNDHQVRPIRGQVVRVKAPWVKTFVMDSTSASNSAFPGSYILPNVDFCVLGGSHDLDEWDMNPDPRVTERIIKTCSKLIPGLEKAEIIESKCGLRPGRFNVRIEKEKIYDGKGGEAMVVHNYGHGGIGVTLHIGTGQEAARLVLDCVQQLKTKSKL